MSLLPNHVWKGLALLAALGWSTSHAQAQQGNFHLPVEAQWGNVVLQPGFYRFSIPMRTVWPEIMEISGQGKTISILPELEASQRPSTQSYLSLLNIHGTYFIREFHSGASEKVFTFPLPKTIESQFKDFHQISATRLPIGVSGQ